MNKRTFLVFASFALTSGNVFAQDVVTLVQQSAREYATGYLNPLGNMFSAMLNTGQYHTADVGSIHIYASLQATAAWVPQKEQTFSPSFDLTTGSDPDLPPELRNQTLHIHKNNVPTVFGGQTHEYLIDTTINNQHYTIAPLPSGIDQQLIPLVVPHIEIGTFAGTELILRGMPSVATNSKLGKVGFWGVGLRHALLPDIPMLPLDVSAQIMYQRLSLGDVATVQALNLALLGSIDLPIVTLYGGIQLERAEFHAHYKFNDPAITQDVDFSITSTNNVRATVGATLKVLVLFINAQVTIAPVKTIGLGVGVRIPPSLL